MNIKVMEMSQVCGSGNKINRRPNKTMYWVDVVLTKYFTRKIECSKIVHQKYCFDPF